MRCTRLHVAAFARLGLAVALTLDLTACGPALLPEERGGPDSHETLRRVTGDYWEEQLRHTPLLATALGDRRRDAELGRASPAEHERHLRAMRGLQGRVRLVNRKDLSEPEKVTAEMLELVLGAEIGVDDACRTHQWAVGPLTGPQVTLPDLPRFHTVATVKHGEDLLARYLQVDEYFRDVMANLRDGLQAGLVAPRASVERVMQQLDLVLARPVDQSPFLAPVLTPPGGGALPKGLGDPWKEKLRAAVNQSVYGGLRAYRAFLEKEVLPRTRDAPGLGSLSLGAACHAAHLKAETGTDQSPAKLRALGEAEVARLEKEMAALVRAHAGVELAAYLKELPTRKNQVLPSPEALLEHHRELMARALRALPRAFGRLPRTVLELRAADRPDGPPAWYERAPRDGSRPAYLALNTHPIEQRLRAGGPGAITGGQEPGGVPITIGPQFEMPARAFREAVPGRHVQLALAEESPGLPEFQRAFGHAAFVEGWALYAEGLADELGLYRTADEKLGQLVSEMARAATLVADLGLHTQGWTRARAAEYLAAKTGMAAPEAARLAERCISFPGEAVAAKVGELEIRKLRAEAERALGPKFDVRAFHDRLLGQGAVGWGTARRVVEAWVAEAKR